MSAFADSIARANAPDLAPVDGAAFLAADIPPPEWIIPDFIAKHYQCALFGKSKSRKTFFALQLGLSVACGEKYLAFPAPDRPRRVAYFNLELMPYFMQERMKAQTDAMGTRPGNGFFKVYNLRGQTAALRGVFMDADGNPTPDNELTRQLEDDNIDLAIIDPRYKLMQGNEDENSAAGLRALLDFRAALADVCAVLLVGHDPKGDVSGKATLDRGAGSYTAIADDDCTILLTPNEYADNAVTVETIHRNRAPIAPFAALFDVDKRAFVNDPHIPVDTTHGKKNLTPQEKAKKNAATQAEFRSAALAVAAEAGRNLLGKTGFKQALAKLPGGAAIGYHAVDDMLGALIDRHILATTPELERKPDGKAGKRLHGATFVSTPERIAEYRAAWGIDITDFTDLPKQGLETL